MTTPATAAIVDGVLDRETLVIGSPPPHGRDLDLLVQDERVAPLRSALLGAGLAAVGDEIVHFGGGTATGVDVIALSEFRLPFAEAAALFADARPIAGYQHLRRPSPAHFLLLLALFAHRDGGVMLPKRHGRGLGALAEDAGAPDAARARAGAWGVAAELDAVLAALAEPPAASKRRLKLKRGALVAMSGLDGSRTSTQAGALRDALERLGTPAEVIWTPSRVDNPVALAWARLRAIGPPLLRGRVVICVGYSLDSAVDLRYRSGDDRVLAAAILRRLTLPPRAGFLLDADGAVDDPGLTPEQARRRAALYREEHERHGVTMLDASRPADDLAAEIGLTVYRALSGLGHKSRRVWRADRRPWQGRRT